MGAQREPNISDESLYDRDAHAWALPMAELLRTRNAAALDWDNLAEELEGLSAGDRRELYNRIRVSMIHLLEWQWQPEHQSKSWSNTIRNQREEVESLLDQSPSVRRFVPDAVERGYSRAARTATEEMGLLNDPLPAVPPFSSEQILDRAYLPE